MHLLALAGGMPDVGGLVGCCFMFPLLPLVAVLAILAVHRDRVWPAVTALVLAGLPCLALWVSVATAQPSDDWEVTEIQDGERKLAWCYSLPVAVAGWSLCRVTGARLRRGEPVWEPDWGWIRRRAVWLVALVALLALLAR